MLHAVLRSKQLPLKSNKSVNLCHHSRVLAVIHLEQGPVIYEITFVLLSGGIFGVQLSVSERDVCLPQSEQAEVLQIPQITSSHLTLSPSLSSLSTGQVKTQAERHTEIKAAAQKQK